MSKLWKIAMTALCLMLYQGAFAQIIEKSRVIELNNQDSTICRSQFANVNDRHPVILTYSSDDSTFSPLVMQTYEAVAKKLYPARAFFKYDVSHAKNNNAIKCLGMKNSNLIFPVIMVVWTIISDEVSGPSRAHEGTKWDEATNKYVSISQEELTDLITVPSLFGKNIQH